MTPSQAYRAALEAAAKAVGPKRPRPCDCEFCDCRNTGAAEDVAAWDAEAWAEKMIRALPVPEDDAVKCHDCGRPYGNEHGFPDLVVAHDKWTMISPTKSEGGLLCPSCMCKRAFDAGIECPAKFTSGPFAAIRDRPVPTYRIARTAEEDYPFSDASLFEGCVIGVPEDGDAVVSVMLPRWALRALPVPQDAENTVLVPREPTQHMLTIGHAEMEKALGYMIHQPVISDIYRAMIEAKE